MLFRSPIADDTVAGSLIAGMNTMLLNRGPPGIVHVNPATLEIRNRSAADPPGTDQLDTTTIPSTTVRAAPVHEQIPHSDNPYASQEASDEDADTPASTLAPEVNGYLEGGRYPAGRLTSGP